MKREIGLWALLYFVVLVAAVSCLSPSTLYVDEEEHMKLIVRYLAGNFAVPDWLLMWPGYHLLAAGWVWIWRVEWHDVDRVLLFSRLFTVLMSVLGLGAFIACAYYLDPDRQRCRIKAVLFACCPLLVPYNCMVLTDVPAMTFLLCALYFTLRSSYSIAAVCSLAAVCVRQVCLPWLLFFAAYGYLQDSGVTGRTRGSALRGLWPFGLALAVILSVVVSCRGFVLHPGARHLNPTRLYAGNPFMMWFYFFCLFLPMNLHRWRSVVKRLRQPVVGIGVAAFYTLFLLVFDPDEPQLKLVGYLTNHLLFFFCSSLWTRTLLFVMMAWMALCLLDVPLATTAAYLVYPASMLYVMPLWIVSSRFFMFPFAAVLIFTRDVKPMWRSTLLLYVATSGILFYWTLTAYLFPC